MKANTKRLAFSMLIVVAIAAIWISTSKTSAFYYMLVLERFDPARAAKQANLSKDDPTVIKLALEYFKSHGRASRNLCTLILIRTVRADQVDAPLQNMINESSLHMSPRMEAAEILWFRSRNPVYLENVFELVQSPGPWEIAFGRRFLQSQFAVPEIGARFSIPPNLPLNITPEEFRSWLISTNLFMGVSEQTNSPSVSFPEANM